jgi:acetyltransferase
MLADRCARPIRSEAAPARGVAPIVIRPVRPDDESRLAAFFRGLSPHSRQRRFHGGVNELPPRVVAQFVRRDDGDALGLLAVLTCAGREVVIGEAAYAITHSRTRNAEIAIAVADNEQGRGLGKRLLRSLLSHAVANNVMSLYGAVQPDNKAMLALARALGFTERRDAADARLRRVERCLPRPCARATLTEGAAAI